MSNPPAMLLLASRSTIAAASKRCQLLRQSAYQILQDARDRAVAAGAANIEERAIEGAPVDVLVDLVAAVKADLLVVGNLGLSSIAGRLLGSVPANVARRTTSDVLIVHTTG